MHAQARHKGNAAGTFTVTINVIPCEISWKTTVGLIQIIKLNKPHAPWKELTFDRKYKKNKKSTGSRILAIVLASLGSSFLTFQQMICPPTAFGRP